MLVKELQELCLDKSQDVVIYHADDDTIDGCLGCYYGAIGHVPDNLLKCKVDSFRVCFVDNALEIYIR